MNMTTIISKFHYVSDFQIIGMYCGAYDISLVGAGNIWEDNGRMYSALHISKSEIETISVFTAETKNKLPSVKYTF